MGKLIDFSLVTGGPLFQIWRGARLAGDALELTRRRVALMALVAWIPLLLLSMAEGHAWGNSVALTFLKDVETHVKLLIAVPLLIIAEVKVHHRLNRIVRIFLERGLIPDHSRSKFDAAIASAMRLRDSVVAELLLIVFVYVVGMLFIWRTQSTLDTSTWYSFGNAESFQLSRAGWWAVCVSLPIAQFLLVRWYFRLFIWAQLLWRISRIELKLLPTHPDGVAGLRFLAARHAFTPLLLAQGAVLAGMMANRIFYADATLLEFKAELIGTVTLMTLAILGPLLAFKSKLREVRRQGMDDYGTLGQRYSSEFDRKWIRSDAAGDESLLGSADIQSMADLRNSVVVISDMNTVSFTFKNVLDLAAITLLPVAPLLLTTFSVEQLLDRMLKVLF
jgi:hypothetical protein